MGKVKELERKKKYFMIVDYVQDKIMNKIKENISIEKFDDTAMLIDTIDKLPDNITLLLSPTILRRSVIRSIKD